MPDSLPGRLIAIGDVHGCTLQLDSLWNAIKPTSADTLVFLGDYVDRGPDSKGVIDRLIEWKKTHNLVCLRGNHELMMQRSKDSLSDRRIWTQVGGADCLASYSPVPGRMGKLEEVPDEHWEFMDRDLENYYETNRFIFAHASIVPNLPMDEQDENWLLWESVTWPIAHESGKVLICGHTSQRSGNILDLGTTICIDTYAYGGGMLTALDCTTFRFWQANLIGRVCEGNLPKR